MEERDSVVCSVWNVKQWCDTSLCCLDQGSFFRQVFSEFAFKLLLYMSEWINRWWVVYFSTNSFVHLFLQPIVRRKLSDLTITTPAWTALSRPQSGAPALKPAAWGCPRGSPIRTVGVRWWSRADCVWSDPVTTSRTRRYWHSSHQRYVWTIWMLHSLQISFYALA